MSAGQIVSVNQRLRVPVAVVALATTFAIGAVAGATIPAALSGTSHARSGSPFHAVLPVTPSGADMTSAANKALYGAAARSPRSGTDMTSAANAALYGDK